MQMAQEHQVAEECMPHPVEIEAAAPLIDFNSGDSTAGLDAIEQEALMFNLDASLRVFARYQFFNWTQGPLQSLIKHELLICARRNEGASAQSIDSFFTCSVEPDHFNELFRRDAVLVPY